MAAPPDILKLANIVALRDVVAEVTEIKPETVHAAQDIFRGNERDFAPAPPEPVHPEPAPRYIEDEEEEEEYDAEESAKSLVYCLTALDSTILTMVALGKSRHSAGGGKAIKKMRDAYVKSMSGAKLTETEENQMVAFQKYKADMELLSDDMIYKPAKLQQLIDAAIPYCQETKLKVGTATAFWSSYAGALVEKITKIVIK